MKLFTGKGSQQAVLSHRERQILTLLALGTGNKQIAAQLGISISTVKGHVRRLQAGLNRDRVQLAVFATLHPEALRGEVVDTAYVPPVPLDLVA